MAYLRTDFRHPGGNLLAAEQHFVLGLFHGLCHSSTDVCQEYPQTVATSFCHRARDRLIPLWHLLGRSSFLFAAVLGFTASRESTRLYCRSRRTHVSLHSHRTLFHRHLWPLPVVGIRLCLLDALSQFSASWHRC